MKTSNAELKTMLESLQADMSKLLSKVGHMEGLLREEFDEDPSQLSDSEILANGERYDYFILRDRDDMDDFRQLVYYIKSHPERFNQREVDYAGYTDKTFSDIRLSKFAVTVMKQAYRKIYGHDWTLNFELIYMYKYKGRILWADPAVVNAPGA